MKSLKTLIQLQKTRVDEHRLILARLQERLDQIDGQIAGIEIRKAKEQQVAEDGEARGTYGAFAKNLVNQGRVLQKERIAAAAATQLAQAKLAELFEEQKRYEIAEQQRLANALAEEKRRETIALDEIGGIMHERKKS